MEITNEQLQYLISCPKRILNPPKKTMQVIGIYLKNDFTAICDESKEEFSVFIRQSTLLVENFSIGLVWQNKDIGKSIILMRCNGLHGGNRNVEYHNYTHIHYLNLSLVSSDTFTESDVQITTEYSTFDDALFYFSNKCNIIGMGSFFPCIGQLSLFKGDEGA